MKLPEGQTEGQSGSEGRRKPSQDNAKRNILIYDFYLSGTRSVCITRPYHSVEHLVVIFSFGCNFPAFSA